MATRGVFGIIQNGDFKGFFNTGAFLPYFLKDTKDLIDSLTEDFNLSSITLVDSGLGERGSKKYEIESLIDIEMNKYLLDKEYSSDNWINPIAISPKNSGISLVKTFGYNLPDASFRPLDSLFIELVVIINLDSRMIDIYKGGFKGGIFEFYPELKECSSKEEFIEKAESFGQGDNIFVDMYAKHYIDFKKSSEKRKSMTIVEKREQDFTSRETCKFLTSARMFNSGPVTKIASIDFSILSEPTTDDNSIIKSYICFETLGSAIDTYYNQKVDKSFEIDNGQQNLLKNLNDMINSEVVNVYI